ncbi:choice-of-anchor M domain-containing protein [Microbacterium album]|uniref:Surface-anchored protein n=1 Tax=Microbacterium album TaxID=2053191 RepID=A0A917IGS8_9MICO|nr:choice-of-anchor M domain-containing protein [Microbacterium album]GGH50665.1 hypothetical protein GCM10010921_29560 [Microbacterium album]
MSPRPRSLRRSLLAAVALAVLVPAGAAVADTGDDGLGQVIDPNQAQGTGQVVLDRGHIDFGPTLNTGEWIIQIHDDTSTPTYWRHLRDVVARVSDAAKRPIPDNEQYAFLGQEPGKEVWVIPQTQEPDVIWTGWNTQEPNVLDNLNLGATLRVLGVDGPGDVTVYLQSGNFGDPQPLWSTLQPFPQEAWIEVNVHTHANWVFSEPGIYLVEIEFAGELRDGTSVSARDSLRFAVGDETPAEDAFAATFDDSQLEEQPAGPEDVEDTAASAPEDTEPAAGLGAIVGMVVGIVAAVLLIAIVAVIVATNRAKARARAARSGDDQR